MVDLVLAWKVERNRQKFFHHAVMGDQRSQRGELLREALQ